MKLSEANSTPNNPPIKVIIDTNIWISFLIGKTFTELKPLIVYRTVEIIWCPQLRDEIQLVTQRPKLQKYFPATKVQELLEFLDIIGQSVEVQSTVTLCRDAKDNFLLALAKDSQADYLITTEKWYFRHWAIAFSRERAITLRVGKPTRIK